MTPRLAGLLLALAIGASGCAPAPHAATAAPSSDTALVSAILSAELAHDSTAPALAQGMASDDPRIAALARRARARMADTLFTARGEFPVPPPARPWPEPAWKPRYRALAGARTDCGAMRAALDDSVLPVRLRAMTVVDTACRGSAALTDRLEKSIGTLATVTSADSGVRGWHEGAHALVALARLSPDRARANLEMAAAHPQARARAYAARAAFLAADTALLHRLALDPDPNVGGTAIPLLARLAGHAADATYLAALGRQQLQTTRTAAEALAGSTHAEAASALERALAHWSQRRSASERDVRAALRQALGQPPVVLEAVESPRSLAPEAAVLALGAERFLEVTMAPESGGGRFVVRLRGDVAPMMAARILELAARGYYDGTAWHRVEHDFVVQGGSAGSDEYIGHPEFLRDELGTLSHLRGTVGMSTRGHDTGDAQWFINLRDNARLDPTYTVFGEVVRGMDVVDGVLEGDVMLRIRPVPAPAGRD